MRIVSQPQLSKILRNLAPTNPRVVTGSHSATPWDALAVVDGTFPEYRLCIPNARQGIPTRKGVTHETIFVGPGMRGLPNLRYVPTRLSLSSRLYRDVFAPDVVIVQARACATSQALSHTLSLGTEVNILPTVIKLCHARGGIVVAELNQQMPYTYGDSELSPETFDYAIEVDRPLDSIPVAVPTPNDSRIAGHVARLVPSGATLVPGIGAAPSEALLMLDGCDYRVWTEMLPDAVMRLAQRGLIERGSQIVASFALGSQELYAWLDHNRHVTMRRTEVTNNPANVAEQRKMTAILGAIQVDLAGQANASHIRGKIYSGLGGQPDFHIGAMHAKDGLSIIALHAWHVKAGVSTIVARLTEPVTTMQPSYVVTEFGPAKINGAPEAEQAEALISVADPRARMDLTLAHYGRDSIQDEQL